VAAEEAGAPDGDEGCLFCMIVAGDVPADIVRDDEHALAFRDINPKAPTHVLVIPKRHSPTLPDLAAADPEAAVAVLLMAGAVAESEGVGDGYRLACNNGAAAQQTVFHAHAHVLGGREFSWPPG